MNNLLCLNSKSCCTENCRLESKIYFTDSPSEAPERLWINNGRFLNPFLRLRGCPHFFFVKLESVVCTWENKLLFCLCFKLRKATKVFFQKKNKKRCFCSSVFFYMWCFLGFWSSILDNFKKRVFQESRCKSITNVWSFLFFSWFHR